MSEVPTNDPSQERRPPKIGDSLPASALTGRPIPTTPPPGKRPFEAADLPPTNTPRTNPSGDDEASSERAGGQRRRNGRGRGRPADGTSPEADGPLSDGADEAAVPSRQPRSNEPRSEVAEGEGTATAAKKRRRRRSRSTNSGGGGTGGSTGGGGGQRNSVAPIEHIVSGRPVELDEAQLEVRRGRSRNGRPIGRYQMVVSKQSDATHIAVVEGRNLIEYYVSKPSDDVFEIHGNIYLGRVQNVLPGMEAAFVDIGTPKNAVLYRGDVQYDKDDVESSNGGPRIEQMLKARQMVLCQVTKNPIAHKGARLTTEVSLPGRFVVLVPNSSTYGISKRLPDKERKRLRQILDRVKPAEHGLIVRTAAENITAEEIERDIQGLVGQWQQIDALAKRAKGPSLLYREPEMATRVIREEFNKEYRSVVIDDRALFDDVSAYVSLISPALADRVEFYDPADEPLPVFERFHIHEQLHKALDRKVWLPSGGSLIIEHTEALTVIDVNTGKNVGSSSLEETVFRNNLEAAEAVAHQLRLRDIGGIIVIDFVDMEDKGNRNEVLRTFRAALARDKTRTQVFEISELGLAEMTRKRIGEGLLESLSSACPHCEGRGHMIDSVLIR